MNKVDAKKYVPGTPTKQKLKQIEEHAIDLAKKLMTEQLLEEEKESSQKQKHIAILHSNTTSQQSTPKSNGPGQHPMNITFNQNLVPLGTVKEEDNNMF